MKFYKPISEQNITVPTLKSFLESKLVTSYSINQGNLVIPMNAGYYVVLLDKTDNYIMLPLSMANYNYTTKLNTVGGTSYYIDFYADGNGDAVLNCESSEGTLSNLNNCIKEVFTINPLKGVGA